MPLPLPGKPHAAPKTAQGTLAQRRRQSHYPCTPARTGRHRLVQSTGSASRLHRQPRIVTPWTLSRQQKPTDSRYAPQSKLNRGTLSCAETISLPNQVCCSGRYGPQLSASDLPFTSCSHVVLRYTGCSTLVVAPFFHFWGRGNISPPGLPAGRSSFDPQKSQILELHGLKALPAATLQNHRYQT